LETTPAQPPGRNRSAGVWATTLRSDACVS